MQDLIRHLRDERNLSPQTIRAYTTDLEQLREFFKVESLDELKDISIKIEDVSVRAAALLVEVLDAGRITRLEPCLDSVGGLERIQVPRIDRKVHLVVGTVERRCGIPTGN